MALTITKINKYSSSLSFPQTGKNNEIYYDTTSNLMYYYSGEGFVNSSPISDFQYDYYPTYSTINTSLYSGSVKNIIVIEDERYQNTTSHYIFNGNELVLESNIKSYQDIIYINELNTNYFDISQSQIKVYDDLLMKTVNVASFLQIPTSVDKTTLIKVDVDTSLNMNNSLYIKFPDGKLIPLINTQFNSWNDVFIWDDYKQWIE